MPTGRVLAGRVPAGRVLAGRVLARRVPAQCPRRTGGCPADPPPIRG